MVNSLFLLFLGMLRRTYARFFSDAKNDEILCKSVVIMSTLLNLF